MAEKKKELWIKADADVGAWAERKARITASLESGVDVVLIEPEDIVKVRELGRIRLAVHGNESASVEGADILVFGKRSEGDGTVPIPADLGESRVYTALTETVGTTPTSGYVEVRGKAYERFAVTLAEQSTYLLVIGTDWKIIPLENIIAGLQQKEAKVIAGVQSAEEARTALETLEYGADGVLLDTDDVSEIKRAVEIRDASTAATIPLTTARITRVAELEMGDRVCVDTCSLMVRGEGMLVGSQSFVLFLVHSESEESPYVAARPFRVNAGAVYAYVLVGEKTKYLAELTSGDEVVIVNSTGQTRRAVVGRIKIEKRPLMLVEAEVETAEGTLRPCSIILQNAETIKLMGTERPISVVDLKPGDEVLVHVTDAARHFGMAVEEMIIEK